MKKIFASMVAVAVALSLAACSSGGNDVSGSSSEVPSSAPASSDLPESSSSKPDPSSSELPASLSELIGIKGSHITDIRMALNESIGIPEGSIRNASEDEKSRVFQLRGG